MPKINWSGDLRVRISEQRESVDEPRKLQNFRMRLGLNAEVNPEVQVVLRLATGTSAISANQTMGDSSDPGMARRSFGIDQAYIDWSLSSDATLQSHLWGGRTANPFWSPGKSQIIFDGDLAFEGLAYRFKEKNFFLNTGAFILAENYVTAQSGQLPADRVDQGLMGLEFGFAVKGEFYDLTLHIADYVYMNVQNKNIKSVDKSATVDVYSYPFNRYRGNSAHPDDPLTPANYYFTKGYQIFEFGLESKNKFEKLELLSFFDFVYNDRAQLNKAFEAGIGVKKDRLSLGVARIEKQADSVFAAFTDSDSNGGGTDNVGWRYNLSFQKSKNFQFQMLYYTATRGVDSVNRKYHAMQFDTSVSF